MEENDYYKTDIIINCKKEETKLSKFRKIMGIFTTIAGIALGLYVGVWVLYIGGIVDIAEALNPLDKIGVSIGALKMWSSWLGYVIGAIFYAIGNVIYGRSK